MATLAGQFFKSGQINTAFQKRYFSLDWLSPKLFFSDSPIPLTSNCKGLSSFDLDEVEDVAVDILQQPASLDYKHSLLFKGVTSIAGLLRATFKKNGKVYAERVFTLPLESQQSGGDLINFHTFAYWFIASVTQNSIFHKTGDTFDSSFEQKMNGLQTRLLYHNPKEAKVKNPKSFDEMYGDLSKANHGAYRGLAHVNRLHRRPSVHVGKNIVEIGSGSQGLVFQLDARKNQDLFPIVLKTENISDSGKNIDGARREARTLHLLQTPTPHPNVVSMLDVLVTEKHRLIYMEFAGISSKTWAKDRAERLLKGEASAKDAEVALGGVLGILDGFAHLHAKQVAHWDQKFENLMFLNNTPKIIDLGMSECSAIAPIDSNITLHSRGSAGWWAPEQQAASCDYKSFIDLERTDSYKVGLLIFRVIFHKVSGWDNNKVHKIVLQNDFPGLVKKLPYPELKKVLGFCLQLLEFDHAKRPTVRQVRASILGANPQGSV